MITTPTTFVIGAGASQPYNLPLGPNLLSEARALNEESEVFHILTSIGILREEWDEFLHRIRKHSARSIDAFLEKHDADESIMKVGRAVIAALMARAIVQKQKPVPPLEDWLGEVIDHMSVGARNRAPKEKEAGLKIVSRTSNLVLWMMDVSRF
jgi:hypothetical protein